MIKQIFASALLLTTFFSNPVLAHSDPDSSNSVRKILKVKTPIKKIVIYGNADVIITNDASSEISVDENIPGSAAVKLVYEDGYLEIITRDNHNAKNPVIRVPAQQLQKLEVNGDGKIYSESVIRSAKLSVIINGACDLHLFSTGRIKITSTSDYTLKYTKNERIKIDADPM